MSTNAFEIARFARVLAEAREGRASGRAIAATSGLSPLGETLVGLGRAGSTQDEARALVRAGAPHGTVLLAEEQTEGRGRRGRTWSSPSGTGIWTTVILRGDLPEGAPQALTLAAAVAVAEAARALGAEVEIKWPNDVIAAQGKVAGVLGEMVATEAGPWALLGLGVNYDWGAGRRPEAAAGEATDLRACGLRADAGREEILAEILVVLEETAALARGGRLAALLERWTRLSPSSAGRRVSVVETEGEPVRGTTRGLASDGSLLVEDDGGVIHIVRFGGTLRFEGAPRRNADASDH